MIPDIMITSVESITGWNLQDGSLEFIMDEIQNASLANTQETVDVTGKQGRLLNTLKRNKGVTISGTNGLINLGAIAVDIGAEVIDGEALWRDHEILTIQNNTATISYAAVGSEGSEIDALYKRSAAGGTGRQLEQVADSPAAGQFTYSPATKTISFFAGEFANGEQAVVYYDRTVTPSTTLSNNSNVYSRKVRLDIDATGEDICNQLYHIQIVVYSADFTGNWTLEMGDAPAVHSFEARATATGCTSDGKFWDMIVVGSNIIRPTTP